MGRIRILVVDDHTIVREGICSILKAHDEFEIVGEAVDGSQAIEKVRELYPDIVLMDISMPNTNGFEATQKIKSEFPEVQILILTVHEGEEYFFRILSAGASGYVLKGASSEDLVSALRSVYQGGTYIHPSLAGKLVDGYIHWTKGGGERASYDGLTEREREVLKLIGKGHTNREIAEMLYLSHNTVQTHRSRIMDKLGLENRSQLIKYALSKGLIDATG